MHMPRAAFAALLSRWSGDMTHSPKRFVKRGTPAWCARQHTVTVEAGITAATGNRTLAHLRRAACPTDSR